MEAFGTACESNRMNTGVKHKLRWEIRYRIRGAIDKVREAKIACCITIQLYKPTIIYRIDITNEKLFSIVIYLHPDIILGIAGPTWIPCPPNSQGKLPCCRLRNDECIGQFCLRPIKSLTVLIAPEIVTNSLEVRLVTIFVCLIEELPFARRVYSTRSIYILKLYFKTTVLHKVITFRRDCRIAIHNRRTIRN